MSEHCTKEAEIATLKQTDVEQGRRIWAVEKTVFGNGNEGMKTKMERLDFRQGESTWLLRIITASIIGYVLRALFFC